MNLSGSGYLSDCNKSYANTNSPGGDYPTAPEACQNCTTSEQYYTNNGYTMEGSCDSIPSTFNQTAGYVSDCTNFYSEPTAAQSDQTSPQLACQNCASYGTVIQGNGYTSSITPCPVGSVENFEPLRNSGHMLITIAVVIAILLLLCYALRRYL